MAFSRVGAPSRFSGGINISEPDRFSGNFITPDRTNIFEHFDDFNFFDPDGWNTLLASVGASTLTTGGENGVLSIQITNPVQNDGRSVQINSSIFNYNSSNLPRWFKISFKLNPVLTTGMAAGHIPIMAALPSVLTNVISFEKLNMDNILRLRVNSSPPTVEIVEDLFELENDVFVEASFFYNGRDRIDVYRNDQFVKKIIIDDINVVLPVDFLSPFFWIFNIDNVVSQGDVDYMYSGKQKELL